MCEHHVISGKGLYIIHGLMRPEMCEAIIRDAPTLGKVPSPQSSYNRAIFSDARIREELFAVIQPYLPITDMVMGEELRCNRYDDGDFIGIHIDGINMSAKWRDPLTVNVYLNDGFSGGETVFYDDARLEVLRVVPAVGTVVLFHPGIYHSGAPVGGGVSKYTIRGCVYMPRRR
jgi:predicted 2-oxoglutarate/Fe(II)-dependent dioxygenase YbiX